VLTLRAAGGTPARARTTAWRCSGPENASESSRRSPRIRRTPRRGLARCRGRADNLTVEIGGHFELPISGDGGGESPREPARSRPAASLARRNERERIGALPPPPTARSARRSSAARRRATRTQRRTRAAPSDGNLIHRASMRPIISSRATHSSPTRERVVVCRLLGLFAP